LCYHLASDSVIGDIQSQTQQFKEEMKIVIINGKKEKYSYVPTVSGSPSIIASAKATKTSASGLNIEG